MGRSIMNFNVGHTDASTVCIDDKMLAHHMNNGMLDAEYYSKQTTTISMRSNNGTDGSVDTDQMKFTKVQQATVWTDDHDDDDSPDGTMSLVSSSLPSPLSSSPITGRMMEVDRIPILPLRRWTSHTTIFLDNDDEDDEEKEEEDEDAAERNDSCDGSFFSSSSSSDLEPAAWDEMGRYYVLTGDDDEDGDDDDNDDDDDDDDNDGENREVDVVHTEHQQLQLQQGMDDPLNKEPLCRDIPPTKPSRYTIVVFGTYDINGDAGSLGEGIDDDASLGIVGGPILPLPSPPSPSSLLDETSVSHACDDMPSLVSYSQCYQLRGGGHNTHSPMLDASGGSLSLCTLTSHASSVVSLDGIQQPM